MLQFQKPLAPVYHEALIRAIQNIQRHIPHKDLAIQLDVALEFAYLHGAWYEEFQGPVSYLTRGAGKDVLMPILVDRIVQMANAVDEDVELGFHFCYGVHKYRMAPTETIANVKDRRCLQQTFHPASRYRNDL